MNQWSVADRGAEYKNQARVRPRVPTHMIFSFKIYDCTLLTFCSCKVATVLFLPGGLLYDGECIIYTYLNAKTNACTK